MTSFLLTARQRFKLQYNNYIKSIIGPIKIAHDYQVLKGWSVVETVEQRI